MIDLRILLSFVLQKNLRFVLFFFMSVHVYVYLSVCLWRRCPQSMLDPLKLQIQLVTKLCRNFKSPYLLRHLFIPPPGCVYVCPCLSACPPICLRSLYLCLCVSLCLRVSLCLSFVCLCMCVCACSCMNGCILMCVYANGEQRRAWNVISQEPCTLFYISQMGSLTGLTEA